MKSKGWLLLMLVAMVGLLMASCSAGKKTAATNAIQTAQDVYETAKPMLMKYIPDQTKSVEDAISGAKASLEKHDYEEALAAAQAIPGKVKELTDAAAAKKIELTKTFEETSAGIPMMLQKIRGKLTILSIPQEVPANFDKKRIGPAQRGYDEATTMWEDAKSAASRGNLTYAIAKADTVREKSMEIMKSLGIKAPAAPTKEKPL